MSVVSQSHCGLFELPNELLLLIFKGLSNRVLLYLAFLSRRLHFLALPLYLSRFGIYTHSSGSLFLQTHNFPQLSVLRKSLFITTVTHLVCQFPSDEGALRNVRGIHRLVSRLASVSEATLEFCRFYSGQSGVSLKHWSFAFGELLRTLSNKSCASLTIRYGDRPVAAFKPETVVEKPTVTGTSWRFAAANTYRQFFKNYDVSVTSDNINSVLPLHVLSGSSTTSLTLEYTTLSSSIWATILADTTLPALSKLRIRSCQIAFADLSAFVSRHPSITSLDLRRLAETGHSSLLKSIHPQLTVMTDGLEAVFILMSKKLPNLESFSLPLDLTYTKYQSQLAEYDHMFASVMESREGATLQIHLDISMNFDVQGDTFFDEEPSPLDIRIEPWQYLVKTLKLNASRGPHFGFKVTFLPAWLGRWFPFVEQVWVGRHCPCTTCAYHRLDTKQSEFIRSVEKYCPSMKTLVVNEETCYPV